jgi:hypothetical protein
MRLTIRTLLAWIDEVLPPEDQRDLGEKVAGSGVAPQLVERIRNLVEHAAVAAPVPEGRGLADDPNTAAEFLDNVLATDRLEAFERVCIESDRHLAETAACHRLLAEIARDPQVVEVPGPRECRRLLDAAAKHLPIGPGDLEIQAAGKTAGSPSAPPSPSVGRRRRAPAAAWMAAAAAAALLILLSGLLVWSLVRSGRRPRELAGSPPAAVATAPMVAEPPLEQPIEERVAESAMVPPAEEPRLVGDDAPAIVPAPTTPGPPAATTSPVVAADTAAVPSPAVAPISDADDAPLVGEGGPLLQRVEDADGGRWLAVAPGDALAGSGNLLVPPWSYPTLSVDGILIRLHPNTLAVLGRDAFGRPRLDVVFGRAVVSGAAADAAVGVIAGGLCGELSGVLRQPAGIEVVLERAAGEAPRRRAMVHAGSAEKVWRQTTATGAPADELLAGIPRESVLAARTTLAWDDRDAGQAVVGPPAAEPAWMRETTAADRTRRAAARSLADTLAAAGADGVEQPLRGLVAGRRAEDRMIAAATLALLGEYGETVSLLCDDTPRGRLLEDQWTDLESLVVPLAIARGDNALATLAEAFRTHGPAGKGESLLSLARGFSDHDLAAGGDAVLVESLDDGSLAVRRYAIRRLLEIVQPDDRHRKDYRADRSDLLRREGIAWWRARLDEGRIRRGALPAESSPPAASGVGPREDE